MPNEAVLPMISPIAMLARTAGLHSFARLSRRQARPLVLLDMLADRTSRLGDELL
jgi:hypothetical protein